MRLLALLLLASLVVFTMACEDSEPEATPVPTSASTSIPTQTPEMGATATAAVTPTAPVEAATDATPTAGVEAARESDPTPTPTPQPRVTPVPTPPPTPTPSPTPAPTPTPTPAAELDPTIESFVATPLTIEDGETGTLSWTTAGASSVEISGVTGPLPVDGRTSVRPTTTTTYTLTAANEAGTAVSESVTVTVTYPVVSLDVNGTSILTSIDGTSRLSVTAIRSDGSSHHVDNALVQWESSDPWVAIVSEGTVTAVGGGNVAVSAAYQGVDAEVSMSVRISERKPGTVRVVYVAPSDREFRSDYSEAIANAIVEVQSWYRRETEGLTFSLYQATPEFCQMSDSSDFYARYSWDRVSNGVQHCAPVKHDDPNYVWVVYADVVPECGPLELGYSQLGRARRSHTILGRKDLDGLIGVYDYEMTYCPRGSRQPSGEHLGRWIGGLAHEVAHTSGLAHPPGCDQGNNQVCDRKSVLASGHVSFPDTHLLATDKEMLMRSHFVNPNLEPLTGPPVDLGLDTFYQKHLDAGGLPVVASLHTSDLALYTARDIIDEILANRSDLRAAIADQDVRVAVMAFGTVLTNLPEFRDIGEFEPGVSWDERTRGGGVGPTDARPVLAIAEENLLCLGKYDLFPYEDIFVHEFAHAVLYMGVERQPGGEDFRKRLDRAYSNALDAGLWNNTYAGENSDEYWAEGVQSWFGLNDPPGPIHNEINTRLELEEYDPGLADLIREVFGEAVVTASCHETVDLERPLTISGSVSGPDGEPLEEIGLWAWQGERSNSGVSNTRDDGTFSIVVPKGSFTIDVYTDFQMGCTFVGWYDGDGGLTTDRMLAARVVVDDANLEGITIRLPSPPGDLPFIEHCES